MEGPKRRESMKKSVSRLLNWISKTPANINDQQDRLRYRFVLVFTLVTVPILFFSQVTSSLGLFGTPFFSTLALIISLSLILCRNGHQNLAIAINLLSFSISPYIILLIKGAWSVEYSFLVLIWIPITMLLGGYLLNQREATLFIVAQDIVFLFVILVHPGASIIRSAFLESVLPLFAISLLIFVGSRVRQRHINQLGKLNRELDAKNRELNIYTSLLTHDIGNDLQASLLNTEITSQLLVSDPTGAREHILAALTVGQRMSALLKVFSEPQIIVQSDIVSLIESIAEQAQITHGNLEIIVSTDDNCRSYGVISRLLPMVFANLFRNCAMHAGKTPTVKVSTTMNDNQISILVIDNGPGVDPSIRDNLFEKGVAGTKSAGTGMGLYLIKQIIEIHDGTIALLDEDECKGCGFRITLPCTSFTKFA